MLRTQYPVRALGATNGFEVKDFQNRIKSQNRVGSRQGARGPVKASYDIPEDQWQVRYQYRSPQKVQDGHGPPLGQGRARGRSGGGHKPERGRSGRQEDSSDYGTMSRGERSPEDQLLDALPGLNLDYGDVADVFNEVSVDERRERIDSVLDEILSVPRLVEANLTQRSLSNPRQMRKFLGGSDRLSEAGSRQVSRRSGVSSSRLEQAGRQGQGSSRQGSVRENTGRNSQQLGSRQASNRAPMRRSVSTPKLALIPEARAAPGRGRGVSRQDGIGRNSVTVPRLQLDCSNTSSVGTARQQGRPQARSRREEDLSAEFLPSQQVPPPLLGNDTMAELALNAPTLGDDTAGTLESSLDTNASRDFVSENMVVTRKEVTGRSSVASSVMPKHRAGAVPKYLKARQTEWREAEENRIASIPDPDCPPGHRLLGEEERGARVATMEQQQASLLRDLACLPVSSDTRRVRMKRQETEVALADLDDRLREYQRAKVFVVKEQEEGE